MVTGTGKIYKLWIIGRSFALVAKMRSQNIKADKHRLWELCKEGLVRNHEVVITHKIFNLKIVSIKSAAELSRKLSYFKLKIALQSIIVLRQVLW